MGFHRIRVPQKLVVLLIVLAFSSLGSAVNCFYDIDCPATDFCDETNPTVVDGVTIAQCGTIDKTQCTFNLACTDNDDCDNVGKELCNLAKSTCISFSQIGDTCQLDTDCGGNFCMSGVCTKTVGWCSTDNDCATDHSCMDGFCRSEASLGADCNKGTDCESGVCDSTNKVCVQCDLASGYDGDGELDADKYCNIDHISVCTAEQPYLSKAGVNDYPTPTIDQKVEEGDDCEDDSCCVTSNCVGGTCRPLGSYLNLPSTGDYCADYGYDLTTKYFDGLTALDAKPDLTLFRDVFDTTTLTFMTGIISSDKHTDTDDREYHWTRATYDGEPAMLVWFYDTANEDVCFFKQLGREITWVCGDSGVTRNASDSNATHSLVDQPFQIVDFDDDFVIIGTGLTVTGGVNATGIITYTKMSPPAGEGIYYSAHMFSDNSFLEMRHHYKIYADGTPTTAQLNNDDAIVSPLSSGGVGRLNAGYDNSYTVYQEDFLTPDVPVHTHYNFGISSDTPVGWYSDWIDGSTDYDVVTCCYTNSQCLSGQCCDTDANYCYACDATSVLNMFLTSSNDKFIGGTMCVSESAPFTITLKNEAGTITRPDGEIIIAVDGLDGSSTPVQCDADTNPCQFIYTASTGATVSDTISVYYTGDTTYDDTSLQWIIDVATNCHFISAKVIDATYSAETGQTRFLQGVTVTKSTGGVRTTNAVGYFVFTGLPSASVILTLEKEGYNTAMYNISIADLDRSNVVLGMTRTGADGSDLIGYPLDTETSIPETTPDALRGLNMIVLAFMGSPFQWGLMILMLLLFIGIVKILFNAVL